MASILRSSKFVRYIAGFARNVVLNTPREFDGNFVNNNSSCLCGAVPRSLATQASQAQYDQNLERSIRRLDQDVRRSGRISRRDIEDILEEIRSSRSATSSQSLLVIRCCGNLVPEELPETRTKLVQEIWNTLSKLQVPMDISHYNALLRVYLENEHPFSPTEFLADLETKGIEPNRVTYQRLIARYCQLGDIEGATKILEFMREKQLPVNENVFNALIMGHSQTGDMDSAQGILSVMNQAGLEPSADTYTTLMCGYGRKGEIDTLESLLAECDSKEIHLLDKDYLDIIYSLATNGHQQHVPQILNRVRKAFGYNQDAINVILRLTNIGEENTALLVLRSMVRNERPDGTIKPTGLFFIKQMVKANTPVEKLTEICSILEKEALNERATINAIEASLSQANETLAYTLLKTIRNESQFEIRQQFFWPLLTAKAKESNDAILNVLQHMTSFGVTPSGETVRDYVIPNLTGSSTEILQMLRSAGVSSGSAANSLVCKLLQKSELEEAAFVANRVNAFYSPTLLKRILTNAFYKRQDVNSYISILRQIYENLDRDLQRRQENEEDPSGNLDKMETLGQILLDLTINRDFPIVIQEVLTALVQQGISISNTTAEKIQEKLGEKMTPEISSLLGKLSSGELTPVPIERRAPQYTPSSKMDIPQLERLIANLEAKNEDTKGLKRQLLTLYCRNNHVDKAESLMATLEKEEFVFTGGVYAQLTDMYAAVGNLDKALENLEKLKALDPSVGLDDSKSIRVANALIVNDRFDEAIDFLEKQREACAGASSGSKSGEERNFSFTAQCWRMLNFVAEKGNVEQTDKLFQTLVERDYAAPVNIIMGPLIKVRLVSKDLAAATEKFEWCCTNYRATPWKNELACQLIQAEDAERLQKLTDLSTTVHGEVNSLYDLVFAFVECGRIRQARKILETPGLQNRPQRINSAAERYRQEGLVKPLEDLINATKDINHIDRADIYFQLLLTYIKDTEPEKALGLWTQMQEEDLQPTDEFLLKLGNFLKAQNITVPFVIPHVPAKEVQTQQHEQKNVPIVKQATNTNRAPLSNIRQLLKEGELDKALEVKQKSPDSTNLTDNSLLIENLLQQDRQQEAVKILKELLEKDLYPLPRIFRYMLNKLANAGDVATMDLLAHKLTPEMKKLLSFDNRICHANLVAGNAEKYLNDLEKRLDATATDKELNELAEQFPRGGAVGILDRHPELLEQYEKMAIKYAQRGLIAPLNVLWAQHFIANNMEQADRIWNEHLQNTPRIMFQRIVQHCRDEQDEVLITRLIQHLKTSQVSVGALGNAYSCLLDVLVAKERTEEVVDNFENAVKDIDVNAINRTAVLRVKGIYEKLGKQFNHEIPAKNAKSNLQVSSNES